MGARPRMANLSTGAGGDLSIFNLYRGGRCEARSAERGAPPADSSSGFFRRFILNVHPVTTIEDEDIGEVPRCGESRHYAEDFGPVATTNESSVTKK